MVASYSSLLSRIGKFLYGIRTGFDTEQTNEISDCIHDGLQDVYTAHSWSFFRPIEKIKTTPPYATGTVAIVDGVATIAGGTWPSWAAVGVLKVADTYYEVETRDSNSQLTLERIVSVASSNFELGRPEYDLPVAFEAISGDSDLHFEPGRSVCYPPVRQRHDSDIRRMQQGDPFYDRPTLYSIRTVLFDPTVGSRKRLALYPTPDSDYVLKVPMILRPTMIDSTNQYPVGGETLAQVILESCLAAAERNYDEQAKLHRDRFMELLPLAIQADREKSSPTSLGRDIGDRHHRHGMYDYDYARASRIGDLTLDTDRL